jgi:hypothetical protein
MRWPSGACLPGRPVPPVGQHLPSVPLDEAELVRVGNDARQILSELTGRLDWLTPTPR